MTKHGKAPLNESFNCFGVHCEIGMQIDSPMVWNYQWPQDLRQKTQFMMCDICFDLLQLLYFRK